MQVVRWRRKAVLGLAACIVSIFILVIAWPIADITCSNSAAQAVIEQLCKDFGAGLIAGNLCPQLCEERIIKFQECTNYRDGKKIMIAKRNQAETIVLKTKRTHWSEYDQIDVDGSFPSMEEFINMVQDSITLTLGITLSDFPKLYPHDPSVLTELWSLEVNEFISDGGKNSPAGGGSDGSERETAPPVNHAHMQAMMRSLWSLLQQMEYVVLVFLRDKPHVPDVMGTCGHVYAMEYLPPGNTLDPAVLEVTGLQEKIPWRKRLKVALSLLEALKSYSENFHECLHLCDIKAENFGVNKEGTVKLLDFDTVFFENRLKTELTTSDCSSDGDCDLFDCEGHCNLTSKRCTQHRVNNNLQVVCKKILNSHISNKYASLLREPPLDIQEKLEMLLQECAQPENEEQLTRRHSPVRLLDRIYTLLQKELLRFGVGF